MNHTHQSVFRLGLLCLLPLLSLPSSTLGQAPPDPELENSLLHQDLYLRGFWHGTKLEFDAAGNPLREYPPGPVTLSGIDVLSLRRDRHRLFIHAAEVALLADTSGRLQRHIVTNTTQMTGTFQKKYVARQELDIVIEADANGSFIAALHAIFAHGLADLASSVPSFWKCYAAAYFSANFPDVEARERVRLCVQEPALPSETDLAASTPSSVQSSEQPLYNQIAFEVNASGNSTVHVTITKAGYPVHLQVVQAVGAGLDEAALDAVSHWLFRPALKKDVPVLSQTDVTINFRSH